MKTTKVVDVTLCDLCNEEQFHLYRCVSCDKEICAECMDHFHVSVNRIGKAMKHGAFKSYRTTPFDLTYEANYCVECGEKIADKLLAAGLRERK